MPSKTHIESLASALLAQLRMTAEERDLLLFLCPAWPITPREALEHWISEQLKKDSIDQSTALLPQLRERLDLVLEELA